MWLISIIILGIIFLVKVNNYNYDDAAVIAAIMAIITVIKLFKLNKALEIKQLALEKKIEDLEQKVEHGVVQPVEKESQTEEFAAVESEEVEPATVVSKSMDLEKVELVAEIDTEPVFQKEKKELFFTKKQSDETSTDETQMQSNTNSIDKLFSSLKTYFTTGNPLVKIGGVILFFGLSFLIRFAVENDMVSIEFGLLCVIIFAIALIVVGYKYRDREGSFGLILQGIGIAVFYLAIFSAAKFFAVIPFSVALVIMVLTVVLATLLAISQNSFYLAVFATSGGFLAPILTSTGDGSHIVLFGYYAFLNLSIAAIAWYKSWRPLNLIGFGFTFIIGTLWGVTKYQSEYFATTEPFLILFFLLYVAIPVLFAHRTTFKLKAYVDSALVFGVPSIAFGLQASLGENIEYFLAYSALGAGALYISLAWWLRNKPKFSLLAESFLALGVVFLSLVFAFAFSPEISSVIYALESSAIIWISIRQNRIYARLFAIALEIYAVWTFLYEMQYIYTTKLFLNEVYLGLLILSIATLASAFIYEKYKEEVKSYERYFDFIFLALGLLIFIGAGFYELRYESKSFYTIYLSLSALAFMFISIRYKWQSMRSALELFFPLSLIVVFASIVNVSHPFIKFNYVAIPLFVAVYYTLLFKIEFKISRYWHAMGLWVITMLLTWEMFYHLEKHSFMLAFSALPLLGITAIYVILKQARFWPIREKNDFYKGLGIQGLALMLVIWELFAFRYISGMPKMPYIPMLNPLDLMQVIVVVTLISWLKSENVERKLLLKFIAGASVVFISFFWARLVHYYADVPYTVMSLQMSGVFQTGISIIYTLIALGVIVYSKRKESRGTWIVGASLLGFVILKLIVVDMAQRDTLERIISFLVVGVLILIVGFIAPLPPKKEEN